MELAAELKRIPDVAETWVIGGAPREVSVTLDPQAMAARGLSAAAVMQALGTANAELPAGAVVAGTPFGVELEAQDELGNRLGAGPNLYLGTATFQVETFINPNQNSATLQPTTAYFLGEGGQKTLNNWFTLRKAGTRTVEAMDSITPSYTSGPQSVFVVPGPPAVVFAALPIATLIL